MTADTVLSVFNGALETIIVLVLTVLLPALVTGILIAIFQAATQVNEMTLSFIPKLLVTFGVLMMAGPWMLRIILDFTRELFHKIPMLIG